MLNWNSVESDVMELLANENPAVSKFDLDKALVGKIKSELARLEFGTDAKAKAKLTVNKDFSVQYSERQKATGNPEFRPFAALLRWNDSLVRSRTEFPGTKEAALPNTAEFRTLVAWIKSLRPRAETPKSEATETVNA